MATQELGGLVGEYVAGRHPVAVIAERQVGERHHALQTALQQSVAGAATLSDTPSSVDQYVEVVPTGDGNATPWDRTTPLSRGSARALEATDTPAAAALKKVATSSLFGAPETKLAPTGSAQVSSTLPNASFAGSLREMGGSLLSGGGRPLGLLVGLVIISVATAVMARRKNRSAS